MWSLTAIGPSSTVIKVPADDVVFCAVLKKGPTVHISKSSKVRCTHIAEFNGVKNTFLTFSMSILDATEADAKYPSFSTEGIMGKWKLIAPKCGSVPSVILLGVFDHAEEFVAEAISTNNPEWVRNSYAAIADSLIIKKDE
jgi:hypothetical protein